MKTKALLAVTAFGMSFCLVSCSTSPPAPVANQQPALSPNPLRQAYTFYQAGQWEQAENSVKEVLRVNPGNLSALHLLSLIREHELKRVSDRKDSPSAFFQTFPQKPIYR